MHRRPRLSVRSARALDPGARLLRAATLTVGILFVGAGGLLSGCSSAVQVSVPSAAGSAAACRMPPWPGQVHDEPPVDTSPSSPAVHAWGAPAIIARCGVAALGPTTEQCIEVSGVDWVARQLSDGVAFTTFGTDPAIEVLVPKAYAPEPLVLPAFGPAAEALPRNALTCT